MKANIKEFKGMSGIPAVCEYKAKGTVLADEANWYLVFNSRTGNISYMAKEKSGCDSGWWGDLSHFHNIYRTLSHDELTQLGKMILDKKIYTVEDYKKVVTEYE